MGLMRLRIFQADKSPRISWLFSVIVAVLPILASYASGIPGFTVADVCLVLFTCIAFITGGSKNYYAVSIKPLVTGLFFLILFSVIACIGGYPDNNIDVAIRTIRYTFYIFVLFTAGKTFIDIPVLYSSVEFVSVIGSVFIIFQTIMYNVWEIIIKGYIPFLDLYTEAYSAQDYAAQYELTGFRPTSFFLEPAHYIRYCILGVILLLFVGERVKWKSILKATVCAIGIIISTSSQGLVLLVIVVGMFLITRTGRLNSRFKLIIPIIIILAIPIAVAVLLESEVVMYTIKRTFSGDITNKNTAIGARLGGILTYLDLPFINKIIGTGFGNVPEGEWFSSAIYWLYGSGIIVFAIYAFFLFKAFLQSDRPRRYILFVVSFLFLTDDSFYSYMIVLFFSMVLFNSKKKVDYENSLYSKRI